MEFAKKLFLFLYKSVVITALLTGGIACLMWFGSVVLAELKKEEINLHIDAKVEEAVQQVGYCATVSCGCARMALEEEKRIEQSRKVRLIEIWEDIRRLHILKWFGFDPY
jgi:hypothetical protein